MKTFVVVLIIVLAAVGAYWFFSDQESEAPVNNNTDVTDDQNDGMEQDHSGDAMEGDGAMTDEGSGASDAPADTEPSGETKTFDITGAPFEFSAKEIRVKQGDTVTINFSSSNGFHDWVVDEFDAATAQVNPGTPTSVTFVADQAGTFEYYCSVGNHRAMGMVGNLIVE